MAGGAAAAAFAAALNRAPGLLTQTQPAGRRKVAATNLRGKRKAHRPGFRTPPVCGGRACARCRRPCRPRRNRGYRVMRRSGREAPGSNPGSPSDWIAQPGRATHSQCVGRGFESRSKHQERSKDHCRLRDCGEGPAGSGPPLRQRRRLARRKRGDTRPRPASLFRKGGAPRHPCPAPGARRRRCPPATPIPRTRRTTRRTTWNTSV